jgi:hypothetical protein
VRCLDVWPRSTANVEFSRLPDDKVLSRRFNHLFGHRRQDPLCSFTRSTGSLANLVRVCATPVDFGGDGARCVYNLRRVEYGVQDRPSELSIWKWSGRRMLSRLVWCHARESLVNSGRPVQKRTITLRNLASKCEEKKVSRHSTGWPR